MLKATHAFIYLLLFSCNSEKKESFSFKFDDYVFKKTHYNEQKIKIGDLFVSKKDNRLTLRRFYWEKDIVKGEIFYFKDDKFGPYRMYDTDGTLIKEIINFGPFDSTKYEYDSKRQIMEKTK